MVQEIPLISVIIVNHNGIEFVDACLRSVFNNDYANFEVIFVDNASTDGSLKYVKDTFGNDLRLCFVENQGSFGPAVGRNKGMAVAKGKYVAFLDNDTEVDSGWLTELVKVFETDSKVGAAQSKLLKTDQRDIFDCAGDYLTCFGFLSERARGAKDVGQFDYICDIFSAKSAASMIRSDVLDKIGVFDEDYYMYLEETDLCWRVWLAGYRVIFAPKSIVYHAYGTSKKIKAKYYSSYTVRYYGCRNYISTVIKNAGLMNLFKILPLQTFSMIGISLFFLIKLKLQDAFWVIKAICWNALHIGSLARKRSFIQRKIRRVGDNIIMDKIMINKPLSYYFGKLISYIGGKPY